MKAQLSIVLMQILKNLIFILLPIAKNVISNQIVHKILANREIKYIENITENPQIVTEPKTVIEKYSNYD